MVPVEVAVHNVNRAFLVLRPERQPLFRKLGLGTTLPTKQA